MPKTTITFNLPDENFEYRGAMKWYEFYSALIEIKQELRNYRKYEKPIEEVYEEIEEICREVDTDIE